MPSDLPPPGNRTPVTPDPRHLLPSSEQTSYNPPGPMRLESRKHINTEVNGEEPLSTDEKNMGIMYLVEGSQWLSEGKGGYMVLRV